MLKFDTGIPIVPAHVLSKEADVNAYQVAGNGTLWSIQSGCMGCQSEDF